MSGDKTIIKKTAARELQKLAAQKHQPTIELAFLLQDWSDAYNVGGMFRVADALGARELMLTGGTPQPPNPMISVTSLGNHRRVSWRHQKDHEEAARQLKAEGWSLVAVEISEKAIPYFEYEFCERTCLVLGNEQKGVYGRVMKHIDASVFIPMAGKGRSLNVHVAAAVVGFHALSASATKRIR